MNELISIREFGRRVGVSDTAIRKMIKEGRLSDKSIERDPATGKPSIVYDQALMEYQSVGGGLKKESGVDNTPHKYRKNVPPLPLSQQGQTEDVEPPTVPTGQLSIAEAKRQSAIYDAKLKGLELAERQKVLVPRNKVYEELFAFGQEIKSNMLSIPDKYIDLILACKTRGEAHVTLYTAINESLETLARANELKF